MRRSGSFFIDLFIDFETDRHIVFQSKRMQNPTQQNSTQKRRKTSKTSQVSTAITNTIVNTTASRTGDSLGECTLVYEHNAYEPKMLLKSVSYTVQENTLRASIINFSWLCERGCYQKDSTKEEQGQKTFDFFWHRTSAIQKQSWLQSAAFPFYVSRIYGDIPFLEDRLRISRK